MGVHHAREWPSGDHAMEWAYELVNGYNAGENGSNNKQQQQLELLRGHGALCCCFADRVPRAGGDDG